MKASTIYIFTEASSSRLQYVLQWIFEERLQTSFHCTSNISEFNAFQGPKINYSNEVIANCIAIQPHALLFQTNIEQQTLAIQRWKKTTVLFYNQPKHPIPFDLFAATFYLISRYEEYLPAKLDNHGRFKPEDAVAFQYGFLKVPVIDIWINHFAQLLNTTFNLSLLSQQQFQFLPTYDIDIAWAYQNKPKWNVVMGGVKELFFGKWKSFWQRIQFFSNKKVDPYYSFDSIQQLHDTYKVPALYFFLVASKQSTYDRHVLPSIPAMQQLIQAIAQNNQVGLHPSYQSHESLDILNEEIQSLSNIIHKEVIASRQHFIKFTIPDTYRKLMSIGILHDYSMGYASQQGFRASTSHSFLWFDVAINETQKLRIHPFCFMEATAIFYLKQQPEQTLQELKSLIALLKQYKCCFTPIMHNYTLGDALQYKGWKQFYSDLLGYIHD